MGLFSNCVVGSQIKLVIKSSRELRLGKGREEREGGGGVCVGRRDLTFYLGTCLSTSKAVLPSSSPQGVTSSSRWCHIPHSPGQGPLKEKAEFCTNAGQGLGAGVVVGTSWVPGDQMPKCVCSCLRVVRVPRVTASGN